MKDEAGRRAFDDDGGTLVKRVDDAEAGGGGVEVKDEVGDLQTRVSCRLL